jgi:hypothetical protein
MRLIYCSAFLLVAGCASKPAVVPIGPDTFMVSRQAATGISGWEYLKQDALWAAFLYCLDQKKVMQVTHTSEATPPYVSGNFAKVEVEFMCLDAYPRELAPPEMKKESDDVIEIRR